MSSFEAPIRFFLGSNTPTGFVCTVDSLYEQSNIFSSHSGLESDQVCDALDVLHSEGYRAGMCMLGNSIFTDAPGHVVRDLLGLDESNVFVCSSYPDPL